MRLFQGWRSSASWRVRWALAIKGLAYESVWIDIAAGEQRERLAGINPLLSVPTLELDDGEILCESTAIIEWLDEMFPARPLLPSDPLQRARVRQFVQWVNSGFTRCRTRSCGRRSPPIRLNNMCGRRVGSSAACAPTSCSWTSGALASAPATS